MRKYRKLLGETELLVPQDEEIIAVAALLPPENTISHSSLYNIGGRMLVVTAAAIYRIYGKAVGHAEFVQIPLGVVYAPPRVNVKREAISLGKKVVNLAIDEQRGGNIETHRLIVDGEEATGVWLRDTIVIKAEALQEEADKNEARRLQDALRPAQGGMSVADELSKLAALRDQGVLNEEEFVRQKERLLAD